jgi:transposase InsO family protein
VVRRVITKYYRPEAGGNDPPWLTFLRHHFTQRIIGFAGYAGDVHGVILCRMLHKAITGVTPPKYLSSDNDPLFEYHRWQSNLRVLDIEEIKTVPDVSVSHPFVECLIGTIHREVIDYILFWNAVDLERKLSDFRDYCNHERVHASLGGDAPAKVAGESVTPRVKTDDIQWQSHCRGLVQLPLAA